MSRFRTCDLHQPYLLPPALEDWLPANHLARFVAEVSEALDLSAIYAHYERRDGRGAEAYHPLMMTRLLLYAYCIGMTSSRRIEKATYEDLAMRYLAADQHPDHDTVAAFRQEHAEELGALFAQALSLCRKAGLVKLGNVALDGTKMQANAGRGKSFTHARLSAREAELRAIVEGLLHQAQQTDREEDERYGKGRSGDELPEELADAARRLEKIRAAKRELEEEAAQALEKAKRDHPEGRRGRPRKEEEPNGSAAERNRSRNRLRRAERNAEQPARQVNLTDADSRVMRDNGLGCFVQGYNAQVAADSGAQVIVAADVTQNVVDRGELLPMCDRIKENLGGLPAAITADAGYWDTVSVESPALREVELLVAPEAMHRWARPKPGQSSAAVERMREKLRSEAGKALYALRREIVEPVFGQIKSARGLRRFSMRGLAKVKAEWNLICCGHNLLKLYRHAWLPERI
jgi:transposase